MHAHTKNRQNNPPNPPREYTQAHSYVLHAHTHTHTITHVHHDGGVVSHWLFQLARSATRTQVCAPTKAGEPARTRQEDTWSRTLHYATHPS